MTTEKGRQQLLEVETTCGSLLSELQLIWDEIGETDEERDNMLLQLEQECLEVYRRKVDQANHSRANMHKTIAEIQAELAFLCSILGDRSPMTKLEKHGDTLKEQLAMVTPTLLDMRKRKEERVRQFMDISGQIHKVDCEIAGSPSPVEYLNEAVIEQDLTVRRLEELHGQLQALQKEKNDRLYRVLEYVNIVHGLCAVLSLDFLETITQVHPSLSESSSSPFKSISNGTLEKLSNVIQSLQKEKRTRMQKIQDLGTSLIELWNLMDTPNEEQHPFQHVTCNIAASEDEFTEPGALSIDVINQAALEIKRLDQLKASKMEELVLKKQSEFEEICRKAHMIPDANMAAEKTICSLESGIIDPAELLATIEERTGRAKEEAFSRREIMEKMEKWIAACEEENWLEGYNKDENRYNASKGAHRNLKRAERARATISKIPALVDSIIMKTKAWEAERGKQFLYDGVHLLSTLEEYSVLRLEREEERRRLRDQRRLHEQLVNEQETLFGTRPSPNNRTPSRKASLVKANGTSTPVNRRLSLGGTMLQSGAQEMLTPRVNGVAPVRIGTPTNTESKKNKVWQTATTIQYEVDNDKHAGIKHLGNLQALRHDIDAPGGRQPLSPVSTPMMMRQPHMNSIEDGMNKLQVVCSPMKVASLKSPCKSLNQQEQVEEENTTPAKAFPVKSPVFDTPAKLQASDEENQTPCNQLPHGQNNHHQQQKQHRHIELSFEEQRLGFWYNPEVPCPWTGCR